MNRLSYLSPDHPLAMRHNRRACRIAAAKPGHKADHPRFLPRWRDIDLWRMLRGKLAVWNGCHGPIEPLRHAIPFHMFPLADRIEATRRRAKGQTL